MKYFKITRSWSVKAESETEAARLIETSPDEYLESESVTRTEYKKPRQETGWAAGIRSQVLGAITSGEFSRLPPTKTRWGER